MDFTFLFTAHSALREMCICFPFTLLVKHLIIVHNSTRQMYTATKGVFIRWNGMVEWNGGMVEYWNDHAHIAWLMTSTYFMLTVLSMRGMILR